ncbi:uncharacterized protein EV420DRAFT_774973 [Desarmillaria tabescens]|uniref:Uncharacterized protein n=1 Tax=Armillaria tabescens TaxID=1929756 RepID=A0AA39JZN8_ARMTA|nr:uncharacterized protein EV420DRAFT_774973 [Desarmillaria tabescens]KAK0449548.1 hypothetical protein EV420DRAFT_774973 [Desarmillaria tabescens]
MAACPTNINEFLTFLPQQPKLRPNSTADSNSYTPLELVPPERRFIFSQLYPDLLLNLKDFISGVVNDLGIGDMPCQSMQSALKDMARVSFQNERQVSEYGGYVTQAVEPVVEAIAGPTVGVRHEPDGSDFNLVIGRDEIEDCRLDWVPLRVCSDRDVDYSVLLSEAEALSMPVSLDATRKQTGAKAMAMKLALQMVAANAEFGFFFGGYIAIAARLIHRPLSSRTHSPYFACVQTFQ